MRKPEGTKRLKSLETVERVKKGDNDQARQ